MSEAKTEIKEIEETLECVIEHLDGEHEGMCVSQTDVFNALYGYTEKYLQHLKAEEWEKANENTND